MAESMASSSSDEVVLLESCESTSNLFQICEKDNLYYVEPLRLSDQAPPPPETPESEDDNHNGYCCEHSFCCDLYRSLPCRKRLIVLCSCLISFLSAVCYTISLPFLPIECEQRGGMCIYFFLYF